MFRTLLGLSLCIATPASSAPPNPPHSADLHFSAEDAGVPNPVPIPRNVLALLQQDEFVHTLLENEHPPRTTPPQTWFSATLVHLHESSEDDFVVESEGPLRGANLNTFWLFTETQHGPRLVLKIPAHDLIIRHTKSGDYKIIEVSAIIAGHLDTLTFKFNADHYVKAAETSN